MFHPLLGLILVNSHNLHLEEVLAPHSHANDHGPAVIIGPLSFFQTDGLGEDVHSLLHDDGLFC